MMRRTIKIILFLSALLFLVMPASAVEVGEYQEEQLRLNELERSLPEEASDALEGISVREALDLDKLTGKVGEFIRAKIEDAAGRVLRDGSLLILIALACSLGESFAGEGAGEKYISLAGVLAAAAVSVSGVRGFSEVGLKAVDDISSFSKVLLPTLAASSAASGAVSSSAAKYAVTAMFLDILVSAGKNIVVPLVYAYSASSIAASSFDSGGLQSAAGLMKWAATAVLTVISIVFTVYVTLTGVITVTADAAASRVAKTALSAALPVVGGIIADASSAVASGAILLRNAVGIFGLAAVFCTCCGPFLRIGASFLVYKAAAALTSTVADGRVSKLIGSMASAFGLLSGLVGAMAVMLFVSMISVLRAVTGT